MVKETREKLDISSLSFIRFIIVFFITGFIVKIIVEIIHELFGHGLMVFLAGGKIDSITISPLWPLEFSSISWHLPEDVTPMILAFVNAGGIIACVISCIISLILLYFIQSEQRILFIIFFIWLAFWSLLNSSGYLIIGSLSPFGDVLRLIQLGFLNQFYSLLLGLGLFSSGFILLSLKLNQFFSQHFRTNSEYFVIMFWGLVPFLTFLTIWGYNFPLYFIFPSFLPMGAILFYFLISIEKTKDVRRV